MILIFCEVEKNQKSTWSKSVIKKVAESEKLKVRPRKVKKIGDWKIHHHLQKIAFDQEKVGYDLDHKKHPWSLKVGLSLQKC